MTVEAVVAGVFLIVLVLWEGFESIVLPRRVTRRFRLTRLFYRTTWDAWSSAVTTLIPTGLRETFLSFFGPISLLLLLILWAGGLITGFALMHWGLGTPLKTPDGSYGFFTDLYFSGTTFFTLGLGDVTPVVTVSRFLTALEGGMGFGFLALVISYLPLLNQSFARREVNISLLDSRAGSPPTAAEMLRRHSEPSSLDSLRQLLHEWELWSSELLESHLSYPVLAYFRSQHENQSWLAALCAVLDTCALSVAGQAPGCSRQARLTFAMARHAVVDLSLVFKRAPQRSGADRLPTKRLEELLRYLAEAGVKMAEAERVEPELARLRLMYEPYVQSLGEYLHLQVPPWMMDGERKDNWEVSAWDEELSQKKPKRRARSAGDHF
ncbi:potassium channel family protein [Geomonas sp. RF6]|uniref:potassium channel family protein n=1 Tax=Geomonas sp. RF6 TaxID=2897342 RepID=UPI001E4CC5CD|nr:potassium channel family protein [Geomonas sp. RF6]UFS70359.1 potassium channel family protein [Geomonas sp. RF6]